MRRGGKLCRCGLRGRRGRLWRRARGEVVRFSTTAKYLVKDTQRGAHYFHKVKVHFNQILGARQAVSFDLKNDTAACSRMIEKPVRYVCVPSFAEAAPFHDIATSQEQMVGSAQSPQKINPLEDSELQQYDVVNVEVRSLRMSSVSDAKGLDC